MRYQTRLIKALDSMVEPHDFTVIDASQPIEKIFRSLQRHISRLKLSGIGLMLSSRPVGRFEGYVTSGADALY